MKRVITLFAALTMIFAVSKAQTGAALVTTTLADIIVVTVLPTAAIPMLTEDNYNNGSSLTVPAAITVTSNQAWDLAVKAGGDFTDGTNTIPISSFTMKVNGNVGGTNNTGTALDMALTDVALLDEVTGGTLLLIEAVYGAKGGAPFIGKPAGAYTSTYTYTVSVD